MSSHRTAQRIRTKVAKRKRPYGAKKTPPLEDMKPPSPMDHSATDTSTTGGRITIYDRNYRVIYSSTGSDCTNGSTSTAWCW